MPNRYWIRAAPILLWQVRQRSSMRHWYGLRSSCADKSDTSSLAYRHSCERASVQLPVAVIQYTSMAPHRRHSHHRALRTKNQCRNARKCSLVARLLFRFVGNVHLAHRAANQAHLPIEISASVAIGQMDAQAHPLNKR
jgi:hypothetical protein